MTPANKREILRELPESWRSWPEGWTEDEVLEHCRGHKRTLLEALAHLVQRGQVERVERAGVARYFAVKGGRDAAVGKVKAALRTLPGHEPISRESLRKLIADVYTPIVDDGDFDHALWLVSRQGIGPRVLEAK